MRISISASDDKVNINYKYDAQYYHAQLTLGNDDNKYYGVMSNWLHLHSRQILQRLPFDEIQISCTNSFYQKVF